MFGGDDDDDGGGMFGMFGDDDEEEEEEQQRAPKAVEEPAPVKDSSCPLEGDPKGVRVLVEDEGSFSPATIRSYEHADNTYTIVWLESGVMQYRTAPERIDWTSKVEFVDKVREVVELKDELWIAARRGDLPAVRRFILEQGVDRNETGAEQNRTPFYHAVFCGHGPVVEFLIAQGCWDEDNTAFITANAEIREIIQRTGTRRRSSVAPPVPPLPTTTTDVAVAAVAVAAVATTTTTKKPVLSAEAEERKSRRKSKRTSVTFVDEVDPAKPVAVEVVLDAAPKPQQQLAVSSSKGLFPRTVRLVTRVLSVFRKPNKT